MTHNIFTSSHQGLAPPASTQGPFSIASSAVAAATSATTTTPTILHSGTPVDGVMQGLASLLLLGSYAVQAVFGRPGGAGSTQVQNAGLVQLQAHQDGDGVVRVTQLSSAVDAFIETETPIAWARLLCNIGAQGCEAAGADAGIVLASPSRDNPDYFFTWTRDSALTFDWIIESVADCYNATLQADVENYIVAQARLQGVSNPSGSLADGAGLGEPKFLVTLDEFSGPWGRPQRDGPALRAIALIHYSNWLISNGYSSTASSILWPIIANDLSYVGQYWNNTGFDLWEEVHGSSFFTTASQYRALVEGASLASSLGTSCSACTSIAPQVLCFLQSFWSSSHGYILANINDNAGRSGKDANTLLGSIHSFDPSAGCDALTFQPCSDRALANHKAVTDSFRGLYAVNAGLGPGAAAALGRYPEDVYFGGNPWYLATSAAAEQLYDALYVWNALGAVNVTATSLPFFRDLLLNCTGNSSALTEGTYVAGSPTYAALTGAAAAYADGFLALVARYAAANGSLSEQFARAGGAPLSAYDLTWSYAALLTAAARRAGRVPAPWVSPPEGEALPTACTAMSAAGSYASATATSFPTSQTPGGGSRTGIISTTSSAGMTATTTGGCGATATAVAVTFEELAETQFGQTIKLVGDSAALGGWDAGRAVALGAGGYTSERPLWAVTVTLPAGTVVEYKYVNVGTDGTVTWEADPNHTYTVPAGCATAATRSDSWQA